MTTISRRQLRTLGTALAAVTVWVAFSSASLACQNIELNDWKIRFIVSRCRNTSECRSAYWNQCFTFEGIWNGSDQSCGPDCLMAMLATDRGPIDGFIACSAKSSALDYSSPHAKGQKAVLQGTFVDADKNALGNYIKLDDCTLIER